MPELRTLDEITRLAQGSGTICLPELRHTKGGVVEGQELVKGVQSVAVSTQGVGIMTIADAFAKSGMFPDVTTQAQAVVKILAGQELAFGPVYSMTKIYMVKGRVMVGAEALAALVKRSQRYDYSVISHTNTECVLEFTDNGKVVYTSKFTMEDAQGADLLKQDSGWTKWPRAMLFSKALSQGARIVCPEVISGVYTPADFAVETDADGEVIDIGSVSTEPQRAHTQPTASVDSKPCPKHPGQFLTKKTGKNGAEFWSHKDGAGWCNAKPDALPEVPSESAFDAEFTELESANREIPVEPEPVKPAADNRPALLARWSELWAKAKDLGLEDLTPLAEDITNQQIIEAGKLLKMRIAAAEKVEAH